MDRGWGKPVVPVAVWVPFKESCEAMANCKIRAR